MASGFTRVRGNIPKRSNSTGRPSQGQSRALEKIGDAHIREHRKTVSAWENEAPTFSKSIQVFGAQTILTVFASGDPVGRQKYHWIDRGTEPHTIEAKPGKRLVFNIPYQPSTEPRVVGSRKSSRGSETIVTESVSHPGVKPREFSETINKNLESYDTRLIRGARIDI